MEEYMRNKGFVAGLLTVFVFAGLQWAFAGEKKMTKNANPRVVLETSEGKITVELWADKAPLTAKNFLRYVDEKFYDGTIFHRVIDNFMIQGGGMTGDMKPKSTHEPIKNEAAVDLKNDRGTIAMARTQIVDSATSQFFINVKDNDFLNHRDKTPRGFGYAVFGKVVAGMDVVDRIKKVKTTTAGPHRDVPATPVVIKSVRRLEAG
jgi:peptidyl-prolyl cis-trans isomerase B (cyclophilin B)